MKIIMLLALVALVGGCVTPGGELRCQLVDGKVTCQGSGSTAP